MTGLVAQKRAESATGSRRHGVNHVPLDEFALGEYCFHALPTSACAMAPTGVQGAPRRSGLEVRAPGRLEGKVGIESNLAVFSH